VDFGSGSAAASDAACDGGARSMEAITAAMNSPVRIVQLSFGEEAPV
jgi:hypothetical protein